MKKIIIDGKTVLIKGIGINEKKKETIVVSENPAQAMKVELLKMLKSRQTTVEGYNKLTEVVNEEEAKIKTKTVSTCHEKDDFDPAVGVALALCYNLFGSKTKFHKFVNSLIPDKPIEETVENKKVSKK